MTNKILGFIGGSGVYELEALENPAWTKIETPWGLPSDDILTGRIGGVELAFLPRHGRGHPHTPTSIPYRANIAAMKLLGVTDMVSLSACGSFRNSYKPGDFVIVDQFIDRTIGREKSFFEKGCVGHVSVAYPTCARLSAACLNAAKSAGIRIHPTGTYLAMEGPQFSTLAESKLYRDVWECDVIGMTNMPEAKLAREAEICYATVAMVTDYDSWHPEHGEVDVTLIIETLIGNSEKAKSLVQELATMDICDRDICPSGCDRALEFAILTAPEQRDIEVVKKLRCIGGRVLNR